MRKARRLHPGELDGLVLAHMRKHEGEGPLSASVIAKGIGRSPGAVSNCLAKAKKVHRAKRKPRAYDLKVPRRS